MDDAHAGRPAQPEVSVLIVNFRSSGLLRECLRSLCRSTIAAALEIIVVDNASPDFDADAMASDFPGVIFLPQERNMTYTGGSNIAFARAGGGFILLLNPDTRVEPEALDRAVAHLKADAGLAGLTAYLLEGSGELQRYYRRLPRLRDIPVVLIPRLLDWTPVGRHYLMAASSFEHSTLVEQPAGAFILVRRSACPEPLLEPGYFNIFSDVELCRELRAHGAIRMEPDVRCFHVRGGAGIVTLDPKERSRLHQDIVWGVRRYFRGRGSLAGRAWLELWVMAFWALRLIQALARGRENPGATWRAARASLRGHPPDYSRR